MDSTKIKVILDICYKLYIVINDSCPQNTYMTKKKGQNSSKSFKILQICMTFTILCDFKVKSLIGLLMKVKLDWTYTHDSLASWTFISKEDETRFCQEGSST